MGLRKAIRLASRSLRRYWLRTFFMMFGMIVGISSLTILTSVGESTTQETMKRFKRMVGTFDTLNVRPGGGRRRGMASLADVEPTLKFEDADAIVAEVAEINQVTKMQIVFDLDVKYRDRQTSPAIFGVSANWPEVRNDNIAEGSFFSEQEDQSLARVAIIGTDIKAVLFPDEDALGKTIRIGEVPFQIKGVMASIGAAPGGGSLDNVLYIPVSTASKRLFNRDFLTMVIAQLKDPEQSEVAMGKIKTLMRERHHIVPPALDDFTITSPRASMEQISQMGTTLSKILLGVAIIGMLISGVVIMGLMLISVSERRKEIGVRRSVGASRQDILLQFVLEALAVSTLGGLLGISIGLGGANIVTSMQQLPPIFAWDALLLAVSLSIGVGMVFGLYPAWKAANVDPIAALRP
ncbi:MAG: ABC transporter permease [Acidobacteriota bacterium]